MAKLNFSKLQLKKETSFSLLKWKDFNIEVKNYLPIEDKMKVVETIINNSINANNYANPIWIKVNMALECVYAYTNLTFTDKQKENKYELYDLLISNGLWDELRILLSESNELPFIEEAVNAQIKEYYEYKNSVLGILDSVNQDYSNLNLEADNIQEKLGNPENLTLLKDVVTKLG